MEAAVAAALTRPEIVTRSPGRSPGCTPDPDIPPCRTTIDEAVTERKPPEADAATRGGPCGPTGASPSRWRGRSRRIPRSLARLALADSETGCEQITSAMTVREKQPWSDAVDRFRFAVGKRRGRLTRMPAAFRLVVRGKIASWCYDFCSA